MSGPEVRALRSEIKKSIDSADEKVLRVVYHILEIENENDWWDDLPKEVQQSIDKGVKQANKGQIISHDAFLKRNKKWLPK